MQRMCALRQVPRKYALGEQQVADYDGIVVELIARGVEECHYGMRADYGYQVGQCLGAAKFIAIALSELGPATIGVGVEPLAQLCGWRKLFVPQIEMKRFVGKPARPQAVDVDAEAVGRRGRLVGSLEIYLG